ncbi:glycosyltransferase family 1 protein [Agromyces sp. LHK192]|uniref:glycosyltransferase family 4 protein n=1 Tax=Agromyces sp. LHK192 TaxID=2498704 RepID=UPI000FDB0B51|nr:glycosyltransferase family 1 protein [Agromyces sp. LHK192]
MAIALRVVVDALAAPVSSHDGRYTQDLTTALIRSAPTGTTVEGIVSSSPPAEYEHIERSLPGMSALYKTSLARRELRPAWQRGLTTSPGGGIIHSPTLLAPMRRHDRASGDQVVVTVHDLLAITNPEALGSVEASWRRGMLKRARKYADGVVATTHALAARIDDEFGFGSRLRVIAPASRSGLHPTDATERLSALDVPDSYLLTTGSLAPRHGLRELIAALTRPGVPDIPLLIAGRTGGEQARVADHAAEAGLAPGRVREIFDLDAGDLGVLMRHATAFVAPTMTEGRPETIIDALACGAVVVHTDLPEYVEIAAGAGLSVPHGSGPDTVDGLAAAVTSVVEDSALAERLRITSLDRARAFSWQDAAERVWQLHADL